jgi:hypothetical protein
MGVTAYGIYASILDADGMYWLQLYVLRSYIVELKIIRTINKRNYIEKELPQRNYSEIFEIWYRYTFFVISLV